MFYDNITYTIDDAPPPVTIPLPPAAYASMAASAIALIACRRARRERIA
jgi:hypothetical protein